MERKVHYLPNQYSEQRKNTELNKGRRKKPILSKPKAIFFGLIILYLVFNFGSQAYFNWKLKKEIVQLEDTLNLLNKEKAELQSKIEELNNNDAIEKIARERLGMVKPGETIVMQAVPGNTKPKVGEYELGD